MDLSMHETLADPLDRAVLEQDRELQLRLQEAREKPRWQLKAVGSCYNCDETLGPGAQFCDADCRQDYEGRKWAREQRIR